VTLVAPGFFGGLADPYWGRAHLWEVNVFFGVTGLVLAVRGALDSDRGVRRFSGTMAVLLVVLALGANGPLYRALYEVVPGFDRFRGATKFAYLAVVFAAPLVALGARRLLVGGKPGGRGIAVVAAAAVLTGAAALLVGGAAAGPSFGKWMEAVRAAAAARGEAFLAEAAYAAHVQRYGVQPVPWLVADGYLANYHEVLESLPLILVTSKWVKQIYMRDGLSGKNIEVLPVGCDTDAFIPRDPSDPKVVTVREALGVAPDQVMILTVGGDAASKGAQEVIQALAIIDAKAPDWKYVCKVWPQPRTVQQNLADLQLATSLGIEKNVVYTTNVVSRNFMPFLMAACDIYAAPSRLEGFGMPQIEAGACGKPVVGIDAMAMQETLVHNETAFLAGVAQEVVVREATLGEEAGYESQHRVVFKSPRTADYRASVYDIADYLLKLMQDNALRTNMGAAGRRRAVEQYNYLVVAERFVEIVTEKLGIQ